MIIVKTPLRISFMGGGSDLPNYYNFNGDGLCVSTTIDKYIYLAINRCHANHIKLSYSNYEVKDDVNNVNHNIFRETLKEFGITGNIEISSFSDIPHAGSGLGSSSSFTVGLIQGLGMLEKRGFTPGALASRACYVELGLLEQPIGKQDQYAAAFGGMNAYTFKQSGVYVDPINMYSITKNILEERLLFFNTGITRNASTILKEQSNALNESHALLITNKMVEYAKETIKLFETGNFDEFGKLLHNAWMLKKNIVSNISNTKIDEMYNIALKHGALGGKILGAGGGGYLMVYVPQEMKQSVIDAMSLYERMDVKFSNEGSKALVI